MNNSSLITLVSFGFCVALTVAVTTQTRSASAQAVATSDHPTKPTAPVAVPADPGATDDAASDDSSSTDIDADALSDTILSRPLFTANRQPPPTADQTAAPGPAAPTAPEIHGRLTGLMIAPDDIEALFVRDGDKPLAVKQGGVIDGWTITTIDPDKVVLNSTFGERTLKLSFEATPSAAPNVPRRRPVGPPPPPITPGANGKPMPAVPPPQPFLQRQPMVGNPAAGRPNPPALGQMQPGARPNPPALGPMQPGARRNSR